MEVKADALDKKNIKNTETALIPDEIQRFPNDDKLLVLNF